MQALDLDAEDKNAISDTAKAARLLTDIAAVSQEIDLSGLALVEADTEYLGAVSQKVVPLPLLSMDSLPNKAHLCENSCAPQSETDKAKAVHTSEVAARCLSCGRPLKSVLAPMAWQTATLAGVQVQSRAKKALREGMALLSQADVGSALQIFFNLQTLPEVCLDAPTCCFARRASHLVSTQCI